MTPGCTMVELPNTNLGQLTGNYYWSIIQMAMEILLSAKTQGPLLATDEWQTKHKKHSKEEAHEPGINCEFCLAPQEEVVEHLFWHCPFAQQCWGLINLSTVQNEGTFRNIQAIRDQMQNQFFMVAVILMSWTIWRARNELIFNNNQVTIQECRTLFFKETQLVSLRVKASLSMNFDQLIQSL